MQNMPAGSYTRCMAENEFKPKGSLRMAMEWLEWVAHEERIQIRHQLNNTEKRIDHLKLPVDGFHAQTQLCISSTDVIGTVMTACSTAEKNSTKDETNPWMRSEKKREPI